MGDDAISCFSPNHVLGICAVLSFALLPHCGNLASFSSLFLAERCTERNMKSLTKMDDGKTCFFFFFSPGKNESKGHSFSTLVKRSIYIFRERMRKSWQFFRHAKKRPAENETSRSAIASTFYLGQEEFAFQCRQNSSLLLPGLTRNQGHIQS